MARKMYDNFCFRVADYICECKPGYDGKNCDVEINECAPNPCKNDAICSDKLDDYQVLVII